MELETLLEEGGELLGAVVSPLRFGCHSALEMSRGAAASGTWHTCCTIRAALYVAVYRKAEVGGLAVHRGGSSSFWEACTLLLLPCRLLFSALVNNFPWG